MEKNLDVTLTKDKFNPYNWSIVTTNKNNENAGAGSGAASRDLSPIKGNVYGRKESQHKLNMKKINLDRLP